MGTKPDPAPQLTLTDKDIAKAIVLGTHLRTLAEGAFQARYKVSRDIVESALDEVQDLIVKRSEAGGEVSMEQVAQMSVAVKFLTALLQKVKVQ